MTSKGGPPRLHCIGVLWSGVFCKGGCATEVNTHSGYSTYQVVSIFHKEQFRVCIFHTLDPTHCTKRGNLQVVVNSSTCGAKKECDLIFGPSLTYPPS